MVYALYNTELLLPVTAAAAKSPNVVKEEDSAHNTALHYTLPTLRI